MNGRAGLIGCPAGGGECPTPKQGPISEELDCLYNEISLLEDRIQQLHENIAPVMREVCPVTGVPPCAPPTPIVNVPMIHRIRNMRQNVETIRGFVDDALERLAL